MRLLVVDDDFIIHELIALMLRDLTIERLDFAFSGADAIDKMANAQLPYDAFMLDISMPGMSGIELVHYIRSTDQYRTAPIMMITSETERDFVDGAFAAGATDFINKPLDSFTVKSRVNVLCQLAADRRKIHSLRNDVDHAAQHLIRPADFSSPMHIEDVDGFLDYLSLENYLLYLSRAAHFGNCTFGVALNDFDRITSGMMEYEFRFLIHDIAEILSDVLKPSHFMMSHVGGGSFAGVTDLGRAFSRQTFLERWVDIAPEYELYYGDGRPVLYQISVSDPIQLDFKSQQGVVAAMLKATSQAETLAGHRAGSARGVAGNPGAKAQARIV